MKATTLIILSALCLALPNCTKQTANTTGTPTVNAALLEPFFTTQAPPSPGQIHLLRTTAKPGDTVTLTGLIMGRERLFVEGAAAFILGDRSLLNPCDENPGDECKTPWDTCCNSPEEHQLGTATIQLTGPDGRVLKQGLKGVHGLTELSVVTLTGTVDKSSTPEAFIVNATQLHVSTRQPAK